MKRISYLVAVAAFSCAHAETKEAPKDASKKTVGLSQPDPLPQGKGEEGKGAAAHWAGGTLKATGSGAPDLKAQTPAQARLGAERAAAMDAFRNLLAQAKGIQISAGKTLGDEMSNEEIRGRVEGVIRGYKVTAKRYFSDNGVEIDVELPLAALTEALPHESTK